MKLKISGFFDTETFELEITKVWQPAKRGRKPDPHGQKVALILADAWATHNFTDKPSNKGQRIKDSIGRKRPYSDEATQRAAIRDAKALESEFFPEPHKPGEIIYGRIGATWFSDRVTHYPGERVGYAWVWCPGWSEAIWNITRATDEGGN